MTNCKVGARNDIKMEEVMIKHDEWEESFSSYSKAKEMNKHSRESFNLQVCLDVQL